MPTTIVDPRHLPEELFAERRTPADDWEYHHDRLATVSDVYTPDDGEHSPSLYDLGFTRVRGGRGGRVTIWDGDPAQHRAKAYSAAEGKRIRLACIDDAIRDAASDARCVGVFELDDDTLARARDIGNKKADAILAALAA